MTPHPQTSTGLPYGSLLTTSGAMKWGVPTRPEEGGERACFKGRRATRGFEVLMGERQIRGKNVGLQLTDFWGLMSYLFHPQ